MSPLFAKICISSRFDDLLIQLYRFHCTIISFYLADERLSVAANEKLRMTMDLFN